MKKLAWGVIAAIALIAAAALFAVIAVVGAFTETDDDDTPTGCGTVTLGGSYGAGTHTTNDLADDWQANAQTIISVATSRSDIGAPGAVVALTAAMQESHLGNIDYGDRDSLGLFQMRPSQGWGTPDQILNPTYAANKFFDALNNVPGWRLLPAAQAAQAVERSGYPTAYTQWQPLAQAILTGGTSQTVDPTQQAATGALQNACAVAGNATLTPDVQGVLNAMIPYLGTPYAWGSGSLTAGPFDCSSFVRYGYYQATGIVLPRVTRAQYAAASIHITDIADLQPGDLIYLSSDGTPSGIHHVAMYLGNGRVIHAPHTGDVIKYVDNIWASNYWRGQFIGATRPLSDPALSVLR